MHEKSAVRIVAGDLRNEYAMMRDRSLTAVHTRGLRPGYVVRTRGMRVRLSHEDVLIHEDDKGRPVYRIAGHILTHPRDIPAELIPLLSYEQWNPSLGTYVFTVVPTWTVQGIASDKWKVEKSSMTTPPGDPGSDPQRPDGPNPHIIPENMPRMNEPGWYDAPKPHKRKRRFGPLRIFLYAVGLIIVAGIIAGAVGAGNSGKHDAGDNSVVSPVTAAATIPPAPTPSTPNVGAVGTTSARNDIFVNPNCTADDVVGSLTIGVRIMNHSSKASDYFYEVGVYSAGTRLTTASGIETAVAPGETVNGDPLGVVQPGTTGITCRLISVQRSES